MNIQTCTRAHTHARQTCHHCEGEERAHRTAQAFHRSWCLFTYSIRGSLSLAVALSLSLSLSPPPLSLFLSVCRSICLSIYVASLRLSLSLSLAFVSLCVCFPFSLCVFMCLCVFIFVCVFFWREQKKHTQCRASLFRKRSWIAPLVSDSSVID